MKTRVMIVSNTLADGGAERWASFMVNELDRDQFDITLVLFRDRIDYPCPDEVRVECVDHGSPLFTLRTVSRLRRLIRELEVEVVISNGNYTAQFVGQAAQGTRVRWIARFSGNIEFSSESPLQKLGWSWLDRNIHHSHRLVANSKGVLDDIRSRWPRLEERMDMIRNGVDLSQMQTRSNNIKRETGLIVGAGRLATPKRPDVFVESLRYLRRRLEPAGDWEITRAVWCGEGPLRTRTQAQIDALGLTETVKLIGFRDDLHRWLAKASCFVLTSDHEGSPNVLIEAMAQGTPIVSTDCPFGPAELIGDDRGWLVPINDPEETSNAIRQVLSDSNESTRRSALAKQWVSKNAAADLVTSRWTRLLAPCEGTEICG